MLIFQIGECRIIAIFCGHIANVMKNVLSTPPDMMLVDKELNAVQAWEKASRTLWPIDWSQVQDLLFITVKRALIEDRLHKLMEADAFLASPGCLAWGLIALFSLDKRPLLR
ncbi:hypothetical protein TNCV_590011 [Trichonephila clavipes]|nr:hypothetical protein TNCV_590011 [Trichonephila clavipes]